MGYLVGWWATQPQVRTGNHDGPLRGLLAATDMSLSPSWPSSILQPPRASRPHPAPPPDTWAPRTPAPGGTAPDSHVDSPPQKRKHMNVAFPPATDTYSPGEVTYNTLARLLLSSESPFQKQLRCSRDPAEKSTNTSSQSPQHWLPYRGCRQPHT